MTIRLASDVSFEKEPFVLKSEDDGLKCPPTNEMSSSTTKGSEEFSLFHEDDIQLHVDDRQLDENMGRIAIDDGQINKNDCQLNKDDSGNNIDEGALGVDDIKLDIGNRQLKLDYHQPRTDERQIDTGDIQLDVDDCKHKENYKFEINNSLLNNDHLKIDGGDHQLVVDVGQLGVHEPLDVDDEKLNISDSQLIEAQQFSADSADSAAPKHLMVFPDIFKDLSEDCIDLEAAGEMEAPWQSIEKHATDLIRLNQISDSLDIIFMETVACLPALPGKLNPKPEGASSPDELQNYGENALESEYNVTEKKDSLPVDGADSVKCLEK